MRVWSLHPRYLDQKGLVACWRETLLAQKVLLGETKGYRNHPQLIRFRAQPDPVASVGAYLRGIHDEAVARGYNFDEGKIVSRSPAERIDVTEGQLAFEAAHLRAKLEVRDPARRATLPQLPGPHPLFRVVPGGVEDWEKV
ncbi:pyrimidine dimer DNA glycosylase/endonuclease V [Corynebacterium halotolerans]|uniref:DNA-(Apurinic or apyrimidinic site) lyase / pyrimidine dimer DNA glycosylase n=1 Tax=Corynebacterium halotolerans YIM 70093 = DSM 44683 TaxID=1121362 RepID=M1P190_9CORY|nr:pyrimidine dimer DNA glycosylase/endonuclease V [Corynebacterium halotolerans]AGF73550.1 DNA-(apurinic or apyrimidinic site) lyase / pyrimidine dimer DNA glycosylase [Corynebacterium halotolerans YIM 70093 = DSM 44683]